MSPIVEGRAGPMFYRKAINGVKPMALVVDADRATAEILRRQLHEFGFDTEAAATGVDGIVAARRSPPALVFVALQLNDARGDEFVGWLRSNPALSAVPVIAIRALGEAGPDGAGHTFAATLKKPVSSNSIRKALTTALEPHSC